MQRHLLLAPEFAEATFDLYNRADVEHLEVDIALACCDDMFVIFLDESFVQCNATAGVDGGVDHRRRGTLVLLTEYFNSRSTAVIQCHGDAIWKDVESDDDTDEADPFDRMVVVEV